MFEASALFLTNWTSFFFVSNEEQNGSGDLLNDFESGLRFWTSFYISHLDLHYTSSRAAGGAEEEEEEKPNGRREEA